MKIDPSAPSRAPSVRRSRVDRGQAASKSFETHLNSGGEESASVAGAPPVAVNPLLSVQEVDDATTDTARARAQGDAILDRLDELRHGLLMGFVPKERLMELSRLVREGRVKVQDDRLTEILDHIELRAEVELAKLAVKI